MIFSESTRWPSVSIIWSASSNTRIFIVAQLSCFSRIHPSTLPGVPITTWSTTLSRFETRSAHRGSAVYAMEIFAYLPIFSMTLHVLDRELARGADAQRLRGLARSGPRGRACRA